MLDRLKKQIRIWERDGKYSWITQAATFAWVQARNLYDRIHIGQLRGVLKRNAFPTEPSVAVQMVCEGRIGRGARPMQVRQELDALIRLIDERKPRKLIEIGTARGGTLLLLCRFAAPDAQIVSIDLPYARNGGGYPRWKGKFYQSFTHPDQKLTLLRANSHDPETFRIVRDILGGDMADFLLIDADHSFEGVRTDFHTYIPLVAAGGLIALHDILPNTEDPSINVSEFWAQLEADSTHQTDTIVHDAAQGHSGIGLVYV
ncbi:class I SAM-dependent methyltransferase [Roseovarius faecimaris]|uniref:Class I SAM-dependent methyltransferase n=1 Tax=Roseovarius faecimaris TaxID=2494550 RepID=A0A6I6IML2_9RHOB|nr:class I SAM-dependent methyltransferase [Roseovarius faecimaris]QGX98350.1 class I SAM-dependent methyltransferase [Roseovarius faecimaris]